MVAQTLRFRSFVSVDGFDRRRHLHDADGLLFVPYEYQSDKSPEVGAIHVQWQVLRNQVDNPRDAFVRVGAWPDVKYYVRLNEFEDHAMYIELCILSDADPLTQLEWASLLRRVKSVY